MTYITRVEKTSVNLMWRLLSLRDQHLLQLPRRVSLSSVYVKLSYLHDTSFLFFVYPIICPVPHCQPSLSLLKEKSPVLPVTSGDSSHRKLTHYYGLILPLPTQKLINSLLERSVFLDTHSLLENYTPFQLTPSISPHTNTVMVTSGNHSYV